MVLGAKKMMIPIVVGCMHRSVLPNSHKERRHGSFKMGQGKVHKVDLKVNLICTIKERGQN
jgi:hypothetical protein